MKRIFTVSVAGMLTCVLLIATMLCAVAAPQTSVNGVEAKVGSTVEYTLFLESYKQDVVGIQMIFKFNDELLELKDVDLKNFHSATLNANEGDDGMIYFNHSDINGQSFAESKELAKLTFEVVKEGESDIEYLVQYLYDIDLVNIYDYTLSYNLSVDGGAQINNEVPVLADVEKIYKDVDAGFDKGDFENNVEGTGSGIKPTTAPKTNAPANNNNNKDTDGNSNTIIYVIGGVVGLALVAVVILAISKKKKAEEE